MDFSPEMISVLEKDYLCRITLRMRNDVLNVYKTKFLFYNKELYINIFLDRQVNVVKRKRDITFQIDNYLNDILEQYSYIFVGEAEIIKDELIKREFNSKYKNYIGLDEKIRYIVRMSVKEFY